MTLRTVSAPPHIPSRHAVTGASRWRTSRGGLVRLVAGLWLFGSGEAMLLSAELGNSPWTVLAEGVSLQTPLTVGIATLVIGAIVLLGWLPLRERPGLGTIANIIVIGVAIDVMLLALPRPGGLVPRMLLMLAGIALVGIGSGLYLSTGLGSGPRDGLMTGTHRRLGWPLSGVRFVIELTALVGGWLLGGTVGTGTVAFALLVGPAVATSVRVVGRGRQVPRAGLDLECG